jgi:hypothetical protein
MMLLCNGNLIIWQREIISIMTKSKESDKCENAAIHHRYLNEIENGICILGNFNGLHRDFCWCDLLDIDVEKRVELCCPFCLVNERNSYDRLRTEKINFVDFMNVIFDQELEKIKTDRYDIICGLPEKEQVKCREKFDIIHEKFKDEGWMYE